MAMIIGLSICNICNKHNSNSEYLIHESDDLIVSHMPPSPEHPEVYLGYCFIESKKHITDISLLSDAQAQLIGLWTKKLSQAHTLLFKAERTYYFKFADITPHFHVHLYPRHPGTPKDLIGEAVRFWPDGPKADSEKIKKICKEMSLFFKH